MAKYSIGLRKIVMQALATLEISTSDSVDASIIWLHGLGADGHDFADVVEALQLPKVRFILPHAPHRPVTISGGYVMRAWYDLFGLGIDSPQDENGIRETQRLIESLIAQEQQRGIAAERIILAGFSQGGAIALHTALRYPQRLAGVLALSTYLPLKPLLAIEKHEANRDLPIFMAHGTFDNVISLEVCEVSANLLRQQGYPVAWHEYPMAHSVCVEELADIRNFVCDILSLDQ
jgi:phospholipase/carboxylesterase